MSSQILQIQPSEKLIFEGNFQTVTTIILTLTNPTLKIVAFKIKTTAPKQYCVRPSLGFIEPNQSKDISIMLQPFDMKESDKQRHKFLIQSLIVNDSEKEENDKSELINRIDKLWKETPQSEIMYTKLSSILNYKNDNIIIEEKGDIEINGTETIVDDQTKYLNINEKQNDSSGAEQVSPCKSISTSSDFNKNNFEPILKENEDLKNQISVLKKMMLDHKSRLEISERQYASQQLISNNASSTHNNQIESCGNLSLFGMPIIVHLLLMFFIGLILGKFFI